MPAWLTWEAISGGLGRAAKAVVSFLQHASFWQLVSLGLAALLIVQHFSLVSARHDAARWQKQFTTEHTGRLADRKAYQDAQVQAHAQNIQDVARVKQQQQEITDATVSHLNARLELIRRELRSTPSAPQNAPGQAGLPDSSPAPCRAYDPTWMCLSPADRLRAAENEERHDELIDWVEQQSKVDPNAH